MHAEKKNNHKSKVPIPDTTVGAIIIDFNTKVKCCFGCLWERAATWGGWALLRQPSSHRQDHRGYSSHRKSAITRITLTCQLQSCKPPIHTATLWMEVKDQLHTLLSIIIYIIQTCFQIFSNTSMVFTVFKFWLCYPKSASLSSSELTVHTLKQLSNYQN